MEAVPQHLGKTQFDVSYVHRDDNPEHPATKHIKSLLGPEGLSILDGIRAQKKTGRCTTAMKNTPEMLALKQQFFKLLAAKKGNMQNPTRLVEIRPVNKRKLYERIDADAEVLDVGSGDGRRLLGAKGNFTTLDKSVSTTKTKYPHIKDEFKLCYAEEKLITSFNVLTQEGTELLEEVDGIHIVPNHDEMVMAGLAIEEGGKLHVATEKQVWVDRPLVMPVVPLSGHSAGTNTYSEEDIVVVVGDKTVEAGTFPSIGRRVLNHFFVDLDMTIKTSGALCKLEIKEGRGYLHHREYEMRKPAICRAKKKLSFTLYLEFFKNKYYLLMIENWRGGKPFHSYGLLRYFLKRKKINLVTSAGVYRVRPPIKASMSTAKQLIDSGDAEGVVIRKGGHDYLIRMHPSFDFKYATYLEFKDRLSALGFQYSEDGREIEAYPGVKEFVLKRDNGGYVLAKVYDRGKSKTETSMHDVANHLINYNVSDYERFLISSDF